MAQTKSVDLKLPFEQKRREPLAFLSSAFKSAELPWINLEKEAFAVYKVFTRLDYLPYTESPVHFFTEHRNLYSFSVQIRWNLRLEGIFFQSTALGTSSFEYVYVIEHIDGSENLFADILTRWTNGYRPCNSAR